MRQLRRTDIKRLMRDWRRSNPPVRDLVLVLQSVMYPANVGSLFRVADSVGIKKMFLCSATPTPTDQKKVAKVGRGKHERIDWYYEKRTEDILPVLREEGYHICALEITDTAHPYHEFQYPEKLAVVIGNEDHGVSKSVLKLCDSSVFIPMYGKGLSMNVHVSAAVLLFHVIHASPGST